MSLLGLACRVLPAAEPGAVFSAAERQTLAALADVLLVEAPVAIAGAEVARNVDRFLAAGRSKRATRCRVLLIALEHATLLSTGRRLSHLSTPALRTFVLTKLVPARGLWWSLAKVRYLVLLGAYADPRSAAPTGFVPVWQRPRFAGVRVTNEG